MYGLFGPFRPFVFAMKTCCSSSSSLTDILCLLLAMNNHSLLIWTSQSKSELVSVCLCCLSLSVSFHVRTSLHFRSAAYSDGGSGSNGVLSIITFIRGDAFEKCDGNVRRSADHRFQFVAGEEGEQRDGDHARHSLSHRRHLLVELMKTVVQG